MSVETLRNNGQGLIYIEPIPSMDSGTEAGNMGKPVSKEPLVEDSVLATASETESEAVIAFNFGESTGIFFIFVTALVVTFLAYQFCGCCIPRRCKRPKKNMKDSGDMSNAILELAHAIGQQNLGQMVQQQVNQQVQKHVQEQERFGAIPRYNYPKVHQALAPRQLKWRQDDPEAGAHTSSEVADGPPKMPEIREQDLQQDSALQEAVWNIIKNISPQ